MVNVFQILTDPENIQHKISQRSNFVSSVIGDHMPLFLLAIYFVSSILYNNGC